MCTYLLEHAIKVQEASLRGLDSLECACTYICSKCSSEEWSEHTSAIMQYVPWDMQTLGKTSVNITCLAVQLDNNKPCKRVAYSSCAYLQMSCHECTSCGVMLISCFRLICLHQCNILICMHTQQNTGNTQTQESQQKGGNEGSGNEQEVMARGDGKRGWEDGGLSPGSEVSRWKGMQIRIGYAQVWNLPWLTRKGWH